MKENINVCKQTTKGRWNMKSFVRLALVGAVVILVGVGSAYAGGDWQKMGSKAMVFKDASDTIKVKKADLSVSEIKFKVSGSWVRFQEVKVYFADGTTQEIEFKAKIEGGFTSDAIAIKSGPKAIEKVEITCKPCVGGNTPDRSTVTLLGHA
jgi:hypothetical protein